MEKMKGEGHKGKGKRLKVKDWREKIKRKV
jgi:hypothetical protein